MANQEQLDILNQGVLKWNEWRVKNPDVQVDLSDANLKNVKLGNTIFGSATLYEAKLNGASLELLKTVYTSGLFLVFGEVLVIVGKPATLSSNLLR